MRAKLLATFDKHTSVVDDIASGAPIQTITAEVRQLAPHLTCDACGVQGQLRPTKPSQGLVEVKVRASATVKDRITALDLAAKYSIGAVKGVSEESVRQRLNQTLDIAQGLLPPELYQQFLQAVKPVWTAGKA